MIRRVVESSDLALEPWRASVRLIVVMDDTIGDRRSAAIVVPHMAGFSNVRQDVTSFAR